MKHLGLDIRIQLRILLRKNSMSKVYLNDIEYIMKEVDLPCLISYGEKMGGSHLSIALVVDIFKSGSKILFLTAYSMAKDDFLDDVDIKNSEVVFVNSINDLNDSKNKQAIIFDSGNSELFLNSIKLIPDLKDRVVFIKNIETFDKNIVDVCLSLEKVIISGDVKNSKYNKEILERNYKTVINFNQTIGISSLEVSSLEKYTAYFSNEETKGIIRVLK